jgi:hypothetical protein
MGVINSTLLKWFQSTVWAQGNAHGGAIDVGTQITSGTQNNVFPNVTNAQRISGLTDYRKVYFRNENADAYTSVKGWIQANTPATNDAVWILLGGSKSTTSTPVQLTQTKVVFTNGSTAVTGVGTSFLTELAVGECIYNGTDDTEAAAVRIASIASDTALTLAGGYGGTSSASNLTQGYVAGIDVCTFVQPSAIDHGDALVLGNLAQNASRAVWIKRVVDAGGLDGYDSNSFTIRVEDS